jgi:hypothetical protein
MPLSVPTVAGLWSAGTAALVIALNALGRRWRAGDVNPPNMLRLINERSTQTETMLMERLKETERRFDERDRLADTREATLQSEISKLGALNAQQMSENAALRAEMAQIRLQHEKCEHDHAATRSEIDKLRAILESRGMRE